MRKVDLVMRDKGADLRCLLDGVEEVFFDGYLFNDSLLNRNAQAILLESRWMIHSGQRLVWSLVRDRRRRRGEEA